MFNQTITRLRAPLRQNRGGEYVPDWNSPLVEALVIAGVSVQPSNSDETATAQFNSRTIRARVYSMPGTSPDVMALDRIEFGGNTYEVDGDVSSWPNPFGGPHHIEFSIRRDIGG